MPQQNTRQIMKEPAVELIANVSEVEVFYIFVKGQLGFVNNFGLVFTKVRFRCFAVIVM